MQRSQKKTFLIFYLFGVDSSYQLYHKVEHFTKALSFLYL